MRRLEIGEMVITIDVRSALCDNLSADELAVSHSVQLGDAPFFVLVALACTSYSGSTYHRFLLADGGSYASEEQSLVALERTCYVAAGRYLVALTLPELEVYWFRWADTSHIIEVFYSSESRCLVTWGECEISRFELDGHHTWECSGNDIFTESFVLEKDQIIATDFNHDRYTIDLITGVSHSIKSSQRAEL